MEFTEQDKRFMDAALDLAVHAGAAGEVPVGAVITQGGEIIGRGWNQTIGRHDPSAHAEIVALRDAGQQQGNYRLPGCTLYVTLEPCCMCAGAVIHARLRRVVFAAQDPKTGAAGSRFDVLVSDQHNHDVDVQWGLQQNAAGDLLTRFFQHRRKK